MFKSINEYPNLIKAIMLPNYDIISVFRDNNSNEFITLKGNFRSFVDDEVKYNAPGKNLVNINIWMDGKVNCCCIEWFNGVALGEDYIYDNSTPMEL